MHIITVSGSRSGVGKTTLAVLLLSRLEGFAAIKVSHADLFTSVTDDPAVISSEGKDTALMLAAGAKLVVWVQSQREDLPESLSNALNMVGDARGVVVEGNGPARVLDPDVSFFVTGEDLGEMKEGAEDILKGADVVVVNVESGSVPIAVEEKIRVKNKAGAITTMGRLRGGSEEFMQLIRKLS